MRRFVLLLTLAGLALAPAACRTTRSKTRLKELEQGALVVKNLKSYHVVRAAHEGKVGYLKVFAVREGGGVPVDWKYLYDTDFKELGFIDQFGTAYRYHYYSETEQSTHKRPFRLDRMPADGLDENVMRLLGLDPAVESVTYPNATQADIVGGS